nr:RagB/SusD family nutrient uptake outer membrane protein [Parabacteroides sp. AM58-2XD]
MAHQSGEAQGYFDQIRERAGLSPKAISEEAIMQERRVELLGEGKRYFDLIRFGKAAEVLKPGGGAIYVTKDAHRFVCTDGTVTQDKPKGEVKTNADGKPLNLVINGELKWTGKGAAIPQRPQWTENKKYLPIPQIEIESSHGATVQNPY